MKEGIEHSCFRRLLLSYYDVPVPSSEAVVYRLRALCFKGYKIELIKLWMAQSFPGSPALDHSDSEYIDIDLGTEHKQFNDLVSGFLLQPAKQDKSINATHGLLHVTLHDLVHDIALSVMGKECYAFGNELDSHSLTTNCRHAPVLSSKSRS